MPEDFITSQVPAPHERDEHRESGVAECGSFAGEQAADVPTSFPRPGGVDRLAAERDRYRRALAQIADAERAETADPWEWAVWAHELAQHTMYAAEETDR